MLYDPYYANISRTSRIMCTLVQKLGMSFINEHKYVRQPAKWYKGICQWLNNHPIKPGSRVFEIGPGSGWLLYVLRAQYGCDVSGVDRQFPFFSTCRELLGLEDKIAAEFIQAQQPIRALDGLYDYIIVTNAVFDLCGHTRTWRMDDYNYWFYNMVDHLESGGQLLAVWNWPPIEPLFEELPVVFSDNRSFGYTKP